MELSPLDQILEKYKFPLISGLVGIVLLLGGIFYSGAASKKTSTPQVKGETVNFIKVDISGAISNPGVYSLPTNSRVEEAIKISGGFAPEVNTEFVSKKLNLAQKLTDGQKLYIPFSNESVTSQSPVANGSLSAVISLNYASLADLDKLPGVGPVTAQKIIDSRPYASVEELIVKRVVSKSVYERIKTTISID